MIRLFVLKANSRMMHKTRRVEEKICVFLGFDKVVVEAINIRAVIQIVRIVRGTVRRSKEKRLEAS